MYFYIYLFIGAVENRTEYTGLVAGGSAFNLVAGRFQVS